MYTKNFDQVPITFRKSKRAKRVIIRIAPFKGVVVSVPSFSSYSSAEKFVCSRLEWIKEKHAQSLLNENKKMRYGWGDSIKSKYHQIEIIAGQENEVSVSQNGLTVNVNIPKKTEILNTEIQEKIETIITEIFRKEAKSYLPERVRFLAQQKGLNYKKLTIRNAKTRWGSCSSKNNINLSLHLMKLPDSLIDYVILHELAHTVVKNHSKDFWNFLSSICENAKALAKQLKAYSP